MYMQYILKKKKKKKFRWLISVIVLEMIARTSLKYKNVA